MTTRQCGLGVAIALLSGWSVAAQQAATRSLSNGVYSEAQAKRGEPLYTAECAFCHGAELKGTFVAPPRNVAAYTVLDTVNGTVVVAQRTGLIARRIVQRAPVGSLLARGERFGLIRFGSRTDVYLPAASADPAVAPGERVIGGSSVIARWR